MSVSVVPPYMFRSIPLTIFRGCSCCNATLRLVAFVTTLYEHVAVLYVYVVVMCTFLLPVLLCTVYSTQQDQQLGGTHDNNTNRKYNHMPR
jgi:hypothetical protein